MLTQEYLRTRLHYDPETGVFTWLPRPADGSRFVSRFNTLYAGKEAGTLNGSGYAHVQIDGKKYDAHRLAFLYMIGEIPPFVDHINRVRTDNRWANLRPATRTENAINCSPKGESGVVGVTFHKASGKWAAYIRTAGRHQHLGVYPTLEEAAAVREVAAQRHFGEYAPK